MATKGKKAKFKKISIEDAKVAFIKQQEFGIWDFYSEREFLENLMSQRFNYLLLIYSLFITAFAAIDGKVNRLIIIVLGFIFITLVSFTVYRAYFKVIILLKILHNLWDDHVIPFTDKEVNEYKFAALGNVNPLIGIWIPLLCIASFIAAFILIIFNIWIVDGSAIHSGVINNFQF